MAPKSPDALSSMLSTLNAEAIAAVQKLLDLLPVRLYIKNAAGEFIFVNRECARAVGFEKNREELYGKTDRHIFVSPHADETFKDEKEVIDGNLEIVEKPELETWPGGRVSWVVTSKMPLKDSDDNIVGIIGISRDTANDPYRIAVERAGVGIWCRTFDQVGNNKSVWFSPRWKEILGYRDDEIKNDSREWETRIHKLDRQKVSDAVKDHYDGKTDVYQCEYRMRNNKEEFIWIRARGKLHKENGKFIAFTGSHTDITDERQKTALNETILKTDPGFVFVKDTDHRFVFVNQSLADSWGVAPEFCIGKTDEDIYNRIFRDYPERMERAKRKSALWWMDDDKVLKGGIKLPKFEEEFIDKEGNLIWLATMKAPIDLPAPHSKEGEDPRHLLGIAIDITEKQEKDILLQKLMEHSSDSIFFKGDDGTFKLVNKDFASRVKLPPESVIGKSDEHFFDPATVEDARREEFDIFKSSKGEPGALRLMVPKFGGEPRWRLISKIPFIDAHGKKMLIGISKDVHDLVTTQRRLDKIVNNIPQCVWVKNLKLEYIMWNRAFGSRHRHEDGRFVPNQTDFDHFPKDRAQAEEFRKIDEKVIANKEALIFREDVRWEGKVVTLDTRKIPLFDDSKPEKMEVEELLGIYEDITSRLEQDKVTARATVIFELMHSLGNRMFALSGFMEAAMQECRALPADSLLLLAVKELNEWLGFFEAGIEHALEFCRSGGRSKFELVNLSVLLQNVIREGRITINVKNHIDTSLCFDAARVPIENILLQLIINTQQATEGQVNRWIHFWTVPLDNGFFCLNIMDSGPGIHEDQLKGDFFTPRPGRVGGHGLGLLYVREIILLHGGSIRTQSNSNGSYLNISLPLKQRNGHEK